MLCKVIDGWVHRHFIDLKEKFTKSCCCCRCQKTKVARWRQTAFQATVGEVFCPCCQSDPAWLPFHFLFYPTFSQQNCLSSSSFSPLCFFHILSLFERFNTTTAMSLCLFLLLLLPPQPPPRSRHCCLCDWGQTCRRLEPWQRERLVIGMVTRATCKHVGDGGTEKAGWLLSSFPSRQRFSSRGRKPAGLHWAPGAQALICRSSLISQNKSSLTGGCDWSGWLSGVLANFLGVNVPELAQASNTSDWSF